MRFCWRTLFSKVTNLSIQIDCHLTFLQIETVEYTLLLGEKTFATVNDYGKQRQQTGLLGS